jgi:hypothetical protein
VPDAGKAKIWPDDAEEETEETRTRKSSVPAWADMSALGGTRTPSLLIRSYWHGPTHGQTVQASACVGACSGDGSRGDAGHLIGVFLLRYGNDLCYPVTSGVQGHAALGAFVDLTAPSVDGLDGSEIVRAGAQSLLDQFSASGP